MVIACAQCGCDFETTRPTIGNRPRFCSVSCRAMWQRAEWQRTKRISEIVCKGCGKRFNIPAYKNRKFCTKVCYTNWQKRNVVYTGERSRRRADIYSPEFTPLFKYETRKRDRHTCVICGQYGNCVHHIDYVKTNTTPENCITLCRSCHGMTNSNREYWKAFLQEKMISVLNRNT